MEKTILTKSQFQTFTKKINYDGTDCTMSVTLRYDDECNNGHNTFSITGCIKGGKYGRYGYEIDMAGCIHDEIKKYFPEFAHLIKWHLCSSDGPLYYLENTLYWVKKENLEYAKSTAIWQKASDDEFKCNQVELTRKLLNRLPDLMKEFRKDIEALGFIY